MRKSSTGEVILRSCIVVATIILGMFLSEPGCACPGFHKPGYEKGWPGPIDYYHRKSTDRDKILVEGADYWSFHVIDDVYAFDRSHLYKFGKIIDER